MDHHPDIDLRWKVTHWRLSTHSAGGLTQLDIELAHRIAAGRGAHRRAGEGAGVTMGSLDTGGTVPGEEAWARATRSRTAGAWPRG